jgi:hypothetical protein
VTPLSAIETVVLKFLFYGALGAFFVGLLTRHTRPGAWTVGISLAVLFALAVLYGDPVVADWIRRQIPPEGP